MRSIPDYRPQHLTHVLEELIARPPTTEAEVWERFSELHHAQVLAQAGETHELVLLKGRFDWATMTQVCQSYRHYVGQQGVEATYSVEQLMLGLVVKRYYKWSYDQTVKEVGSDSLLRWFVGLGLNESTFSPATLCRFDNWLRDNHPRLLFNGILAQIDQDFPAEREAPQTGDTYAMLTRSAAQSRTDLLRTTCQRLLNALRQVTATGHAQVEAALPAEALFGAADERPEWSLDKAARAEREQYTALAAQQLLTLVEAVMPTLPASRDILYQVLVRWLQRLHKALTDEFIFTLDAEGGPMQAAVRTKHEKGSYVMGSAIDPEATFRQHGQQCDLGYNISVAASEHFVRETAAFTGATPDSKVIAPAIAAQKRELGIVPPRFIYDRAGGTPKIYAEVEQASDGRTQLVARLINYGKSSPLFGPQDCTLSADGRLTCPAGQTASHSYRSQSGDGWQYRFTAQECQECPLRSLCRKPDAAPHSPRNFFISDYTYQQRQALAYHKTEAFAQDMRLRPRIERIISCLVRYHGARRATGYGVLNADYQARMAAMSFNLKQWVRLTRQRRRPPRHRQPDDSV